MTESRFKQNVDGRVDNDEENDWDDASRNKPNPVDVVVNIIWMKPKVCHVIIQNSFYFSSFICNVVVDMFKLKEFWNIYDYRNQNWWNDKGQGMDSLRFPQHSKSVSDWFAHSQESLKGNGHDQETLTGDSDVLDRIEEVREEKDVETGIVIKAVINHHT